MNSTNSEPVNTVSHLQARELPHNIEAEQALLGAILINNGVMERVDGLIQSEDFYDGIHRLIWDEIARTIARGHTADPVILSRAFESFPPIAPDLTIPQYLGRLATSATTIIHAPDYARTVHDLAIRRELIGLSQHVIEGAHTAPPDITGEELIEGAEQHLASLAEGRRGEAAEAPFAEVARTTLDYANAAYARNGALAGLPTGLIDLDNKLGGLVNSNLIILAGRPSMGKAQALDAPVLMVDGSWKAMGALKIGDELASVDGAPSHVIAIFPQGKRQLYTLTFSDGRTAEADGDHLWEVHYRTWEAPRIMTTLEVRQKLAVRRYRGRLWIEPVSGAFGGSDELPLDPYVLGALIANGTLKRGTPLVTTPYAEVVEQTRAGVGNRASVKHKGRLAHSIVRDGSDENYVTAAIRAFGLDVKSEDKFIPPMYLAARRDARLALLRGLLDGDGWVEKFGAIRYATSSERLAMGVVALVRSLGGWASRSVKTPRYRHRGELRTGLPSHVVNMVLPDAGDALFGVEFKRERATRSGRQKRLTFTSIEPSREAEAQCIRVSHPSCLYVTHDYVVTHNSAMATNIAVHNAYRWLRSGGEDGGRVLFFSLEMSREELGMRILGEHARIPSERIRRGSFEADDFRRLTQAESEIRDMPLYIDATGGLPLARLQARARRAKRRLGIDLIIVDYLQLMQGSSRKDGNRVQEVTEITVGLKALAKELDVPIIALSQLSRAVEQRADKRPQLSDLRESGSIEQDADVVMFVFREEYYLERERPAIGDLDAQAVWEAKMREAAGKGEVILGKQRHGPTGSVPVAFDGALTKFSNLAREGL